MLMWSPILLPLAYECNHVVGERKKIGCVHVIRGLLGLPNWGH